MQVQGQHPHQWALFQVAVLLHTWHISTRSPGMSIMRVDDRKLPLSAIPLCQLFACHLGPPRSFCMSKAVLTAPLERSTCPYHRSLLSFRMRSRSSMPSCTSSSLDLVVTMSFGLTLQICLIITLPFHCRCWKFGFVSGQVSLAWSIALCTQELYTWPRVLKERWREERTGSRSLNFFQAVFTRVVVESSQPPAADSMSLGSKRKLPPQACQVRPGLPSVVCHPRGVQFPGTMYICSQDLFSSA